MADVDITELAGEVALLREVVERRLLEDEARQRLYDELYRQLKFAQRDLAEQFVAPMAREILLVVDRIDAMTAHLPPETAEPLTSVREELLEVLLRRGLREVDAAGEEFDPRVHEAVRRVPVESPEQVGRVVEVRRPGYALEGRLLRPAQVAVGYLAKADDARAGGSRA
ncbi:nucleotide exchange factor GrpE [Thermasporomyces composti]|uniref:Protein GrpE n=1 Tax=Thermasporomyces composti TaxID=696763 RepID=A0A3D9V8V8_THECX|nr:nucleotide exchange factor GrpE [Thermasporomyces composti]REF38218.1 molecular chaperone GrpE [Thermasporomyces composti]